YRRSRPARAPCSAKVTVIRPELALAARSCRMTVDSTTNQGAHRSPPAFRRTRISPTSARVAVTTAAAARPAASGSPAATASASAACRLAEQLSRLSAVGPGRMRAADLQRGGHRVGEAGDHRVASTLQDEPVQLRVGAEEPVRVLSSVGLLHLSPGGTHRGPLAGVHPQCGEVRRRLLDAQAKLEQ